jgi:hypothetical protein
MKQSLWILNWNFLKIMLLAALLAISSCVSTKTRVLGKDEMANVAKLGYVDVEFTSVQPLHIHSNNKITEKAYEKLKNEATKKYPQYKTDVVNIWVTGDLNTYNLIMFLLVWPIILLGNVQTIHAKGEVITTDAAAVARVQQARPSVPPPVEPRVEPSVETRAPTASNATSGMEEVIKKATSKLMNDLPRGSKIAVVDMHTDDWEIASTVIDEIEYNFVSSKRYTIVDRKTLDVIRSEQKLQTSGAVSDETIVKIGALSGANVVIAGSLTKSGGSNRLSLRALDVQTGQIITMARESY